jgi:hypothetical protein
MKLRFTLILLLSMLFATSANAVALTYFTQMMTSDPAADGWTITGSTSNEVKDSRYWTTADGTNPVVYTRTFATPVEMRFAENAVLVLFATGDGSMSGATATITVSGEDGNSLTFSYSGIIDSEYAQTLLQSSTSGTMPATVNKMVVSITCTQADAGVCFGGIQFMTGATPPVAIDYTTELKAIDYDLGGNAWSHEYESNYDANKYGYSDRHPTENAGYRQDADSVCIRDYSLCDMGNDWPSYTIGEYVNKTDTTDLTITSRMAIRNFGCWYKYTVEAKEEMDVDVYLKTGVHYTSYGQITLGSTGGLDATTRVDQGYRVNGNKVNWAKCYSGSLTLSVDGTDAVANQKIRPVNTAYDASGDTFNNLLKDTTLWTSTLLPNGNNSDTLWVWPMKDNVLSWSGYYRDKPDFTNIHLTKGKHVFVVTSLCSQWEFYNLKFIGKKAESVENISDKSNGLNAYGTAGRIIVDRVADVYTIAGAYIGKVQSSIDVPAGVYIVKAGSLAKKVLVR